MFYVSLKYIVKQGHKKAKVYTIVCIKIVKCVRSSLDTLNEISECSLGIRCYRE